LVISGGPFDGVGVSRVLELDLVAYQRQYPDRYDLLDCLGEIVVNITCSGFLIEQIFNLKRPVPLFMNVSLKYPPLLLIRE